MNNKSIAIIVVAILAIGTLVIVYAVSKDRTQPSPTIPSVSVQNEQERAQQKNPAENQNVEKKEEQQTSQQQSQNIVIYGDAGYSPKSLTIKKGETVTWINQSSKSMWPASAMHPSHRVYSGTSLEEHCPDIQGTAFDACTGILPGGSWSFTFEKTGTWNYHDHLTPNFFGTIVVE